MEPVLNEDDEQSLTLYPDGPEKDAKLQLNTNENGPTHHENDDDFFAVVPLTNGDFQATSTPLDNRPRLNISQSTLELEDSTFNDSSISEFHGFSSDWSAIDPTISPQPTIYYSTSSSDSESEDQLKDEPTFNLNPVRRQLSYPCDNQPED